MPPYLAGGARGAQGDSLRMGERAGGEEGAAVLGSGGAEAEAGG